MNCRHVALATVIATLAASSVASAHPFTWDGRAADPSRSGVTIRWDRSIASCGDTSPFRPLKVRVHMGQSAAAPDEYMRVTGQRQVRSGGRWVSLPGPSDTVTKRGAAGRRTSHFTLSYFLRFVDRGMRTRVKLRLEWRRDGADDTLLAKRAVSTRPCTVP